METKPAIRTTEFWVTVGTNVAAIASAVIGVMPAEWTPGLMVAINAAYAVARGIAKAGVPPDEPKPPPPVIHRVD
jgi:hypothetical protein